MNLQRRQVERDIENVHAVISATGEFRKLIQTVLARMETFSVPSTPRLLEAA